MAEKEYIDRAPFIEDLSAMKKEYDAISIDGMIKALATAPAADVAPVVHSSWDYGEGEIEFDEHRNCQAYCRRCGAGDVHAERNINNVPFCWRCGARMDGGKA